MVCQSLVAADVVVEILSIVVEKMSRIRGLTGGVGEASQGCGLGVGRIELARELTESDFERKLS